MLIKQRVKGEFKWGLFEWNNIQYLTNHAYKILITGADSKHRQHR